MLIPNPQFSTPYRCRPVLFLINIDSHTVPFYSTLDTAERCSDLVPALGIPFFLNCYLNIKPLLHRPTGLSLGIISASLGLLIDPQHWAICSTRLLGMLGVESRLLPQHQALASRSAGLSLGIISILILSCLLTPSL